MEKAWVSDAISVDKHLYLIHRVECEDTSLKLVPCIVCIYKFAFAKILLLC